MTALRTGFTTGACAAAAAKAAVSLLLEGGGEASQASILLPDGERVEIPIAWARLEEAQAVAAVQKDAGDDPDITNGALVVTSVAWVDGDDVIFAAGEGVGVVTKPGLSISPGEPAINPVPRRIITEAIREVTPRGVRVTISIPGGRELAAKTFNPRLGVADGLSILGTTGIVRPFSCDALRATVECAVRVAAAGGVLCPVLVPGHIGERGAQKHLTVDTAQVIEVGNEWGHALDLVSAHDFENLLIAGHPGKLAKLCAGEWQTHSSKSASAVPIVRALAEELQLNAASLETATVEGLFAGCSADARRLLADALANRISAAVVQRIENRFPVAVLLIDMKGDILGSHGDLSPWR